MIPLTALSFLSTVFFVKKIPLKRDDDAQKKAEAKAWLEARDARHKARKQSHGRKASAGAGAGAATQGDLEGTGEKSGHDSAVSAFGSDSHSESGLQRLEDEVIKAVEVAGREMGEEGVGLQPAEGEKPPRV
jgi:hypothetical protein